MGGHVTPAEEAIDAMQRGVGACRRQLAGHPFAVHLDDTAATALLEHLSEQATRIADLTARLHVTTAERDRARALVAALIEQPDHHEGTL